MAKYRVIDVSSWQGDIDFNKVKESAVGVIVRYADGLTIDNRFKQNMTGAKKAGLHVGAYVGVGIFVDAQRSTGMLDEEVQQSRLRQGWKLAKHFFGDEVETS